MVSDSATFSMATYEALRKRMADIAPSPSIYSNPLRPEPQSLWGMPVRVNNAFPMDCHCSHCGGSGEGTESTYCEHCTGAGKNIYDGMMQSGPQTILLRRALPKAFQPSFPPNLVPSPPLCRGLP